MPEPAGLSTAVPTTGQLAFGAARLLVASTEKLNPVTLVKAKVSLPPLNLTPLKFDGRGAGILKADDVTPVSPLELKVMVAPVTAVGLVAVKPVKVAVPETAAFVVVPPIVQIPVPTAAAMLAVLVVTLPY